jgi:hypothetical protein
MPTNSKKQSRSHKKKGNVPYKTASSKKKFAEDLVSGNLSNSQAARVSDRTKRRLRQQVRDGSCVKAIGRPPAISPSKLLEVKDAVITGRANQDVVRKLKLRRLFHHAAKQTRRERGESGAGMQVSVSTQYRMMKKIGAVKRKTQRKTESRINAEASVKSAVKLICVWNTMLKDEYGFGVFPGLIGNFDATPIKFQGCGDAGQSGYIIKDDACKLPATISTPSSLDMVRIPNNL